MNSQKGLLIAFEGIDRCGKTTQIALLSELLNFKYIPNKIIKFPDRTTAVGQLINGYLKNVNEINDQTIHLLFSANRWEKSKEILDNLNKGVTVILDRYTYSGIAYSIAKGLDYEWCKIPDEGLPEPHIIIYFDIDVEDCLKRGDYGNEIYEKQEFQNKVYKAYQKIRSDDYKSWTIIDADRSIESVHDDVVNSISSNINNTLFQI